MRALDLFCMSYCIVVCCSACIAREFGPEWTKSADGYRKDLKVNVVSFGPGDAIYRIDLEHEFLQITESMDYSGFSLIWNSEEVSNRVKSDDRKTQAIATGPKGISYISVSKAGDGTPVLRTIHLFDGSYLDLNGNGIFDALVSRRHGRSGQVFILHRDHFIPIQGPARGLGTNMRHARSSDGTRYIFDDGMWRLAIPGEKLVQESTPNRTVARELGPEWKKGKDPDTGVSAYLKELKVPVVHDGQNLATYKLQLELDRLQIGEYDNNTGFFVSWRQDGRVDIRRKSDGTPAWHQVRFPNAQYLDLNGDGIFDLMVDYRKEENGEVSILVDNRFVRVKGVASEISESTRNTESQDGTKYIFENDAWQVKR